jgi:hypothetical protein
VEEYNALALAACKSIRAADPQAIIAGPATSELPMDFLETFFESGVLEFLDAVSVHPYRNYSKGPETALEEYAKLRGLIERFAPASKKNMPILSGEWGYATHAKGVSLETQANFLVRQQLVNLMAGMPVSIWYDWKNDGPDPAEREHNFGIVSHDLTPKPAYAALQKMTRELDGFHFVRRAEVKSPEAFLLLFAKGDGERKLAAWSVKGPLKVEVTHELALELTPAPRFVAAPREMR